MARGQRRVEISSAVGSDATNSDSSCSESDIESGRRSSKGNMSSKTKKKESGKSKKKDPKKSAKEAVLSLYTSELGSSSSEDQDQLTPRSSQSGRRRRRRRSARSMRSSMTSMGSDDTLWSSDDEYWGDEGGHCGCACCFPNMPSKTFRWFMPLLVLGVLLVFYIGRLVYFYQLDQAERDTWTAGYFITWGMCGKKDGSNNTTDNHEPEEPKLLSFDVELDEKTGKYQFDVNKLPKDVKAGQRVTLRYPNDQTSDITVTPQLLKKRSSWATAKMRSVLRLDPSKKMMVVVSPSAPFEDFVRDAPVDAANFREDARLNLWTLSEDELAAYYENAEGVYNGTGLSECLVLLKWKRHADASKDDKYRLWCYRATDEGFRWDLVRGQETKNGEAKSNTLKLGHSVVKNPNKKLPNLPTEKAAAGTDPESIAAAGLPDRGADPFGMIHDSPFAAGDRGCTFTQAASRLWSMSEPGNDAVDDNALKTDNALKHTNAERGGEYTAVEDHFKFGFADKLTKVLMTDDREPKKAFHATFFWVTNCTDIEKVDKLREQLEKAQGELQGLTKGQCAAAGANQNAKNHKDYLGAALQMPNAHEVAAEVAFRATAGAAADAAVRDAALKQAFKEISCEDATKHLAKIKYWLEELDIYEQMHGYEYVLRGNRENEGNFKDFTNPALPTATAPAVHPVYQLADEQKAAAAKAAEEKRKADQAAAAAAAAAGK